jgi:integrase/recombinase XerD
MNDLVLSTEFKKCFPTIDEGIRKAFNLFNQVQGFEDLERLFLKGNGLSPNTYQAYHAAVKQFYAFTNGLHPFQVLPADIENFYDSIMEKVDRNTAAVRVAGLKKFFKGIEEQVSFYASPFNIMTEKLTRKLSRTKAAKTKSSLNWAEYNCLLDFLEEDKSLKGLQNLALSYVLMTTGLRAAELCSLKWRDCEFDEEYKTYFLNGIGKGSKPFRQMVLDPAAIEAAKKAYKAQKGEIDQADHMFYSTCNFNGKTPAPLTRTLLYKRVRNIGEAVRARGINPRQSLTWSPHMFRRTACSLFYKVTGKDLVATQGFSRHASINTLSKHYVESLAEPENVKSFTEHRKMGA